MEKIAFNTPADGFGIERGPEHPKYFEKPLVKSSNMANSQIELQIELLERAKLLFSKHSEHLEAVVSNFNQEVRALEQEDLNHDYLMYMEECFAEYSSQLKTVRENIDDEYIPAIIRKIRSLEERA